MFILAFINLLKKEVVSMSNSVINKIEFNRRLTQEEENLIAKALSSNKQLDFNKLIPQPDNLIKVSTNDTILESYNWFFSKNPEDLPEEELQKCLESEMRSKYILTRYMELSKEERESVKSDDDYIVLPNWYDWNVSNWGTKWNASETRILRDEEHDSLCFQTVWSHPKEELIKLLLSKIKEVVNEDIELTFEAYYLEEMCVYRYKD